MMRSMGSIRARWSLASSLGLLVVVACEGPTEILTPAVDRVNDDSMVPMPECRDEDAPPLTMWDCADVATAENLAIGPELHVVGLYEAGGPQGSERTALADIRIDRTGVPIVLALSAYAQTHWTVQLGPDVELERILLLGNEPQSVEGADVPVEHHEIANGGTISCGTQFDPSPAEGCDAAELLNVASRLAGRDWTSFAGCRRASQMSLGRGECRQRPSIDKPCSDCGELQLGDHVCYSIDGSSFVAIDMTTGARQAVSPLPLMVPPPESIAQFGDHLLLCGGHFDGLIRADFAGTVETDSIDCDSVARWGNRILVLARAAGGLWVFDTYEDLIADRGELIPYRAHATRIAVDSDILYGAWHSANEISRFDLRTQRELDPIELEGYSTWINGMGFIGDSAIVLNASFPEERLAVIDKRTGAAITDVVVGRDLMGLSCLPR